MKHLLYAIIAITVAIGACSTSSATKSAQKPAPARNLVILYTAGARGQIRSCNCTKFRFGGYGRQLTLLKDIRTHSRDVLLLEGGDTTGEPNMQSEIKADVTVRALKMLGYAAMVPGEEELGVRGTRYISKFEHKSVPLLCANLFKEGGDKPKYAPYRVLKTSSGVKVGVIGLLGEQIGGPLMAKNSAETVKNALTTLRSAVKAVRPKSDVVVVLYHGTPDEARNLAGVKGVDLILSTHRAGELLFPEKGANKVVAPITRQGGVVMVSCETNANWSMGRIDLSLGKNRKIDTAAHSLLYLDRAYDEDPAMTRVYDDYNDRVKLSVLTASAKFKREGETMLAKRGLDLVEMRKRLRKSPLAASAKCKDCHAEIHESWSNTRHAHAMATLEKSRQQFDPECVSCHATGVNVRNGYINQDETPELANVGCEACHSPGAAHAAVPAKGYGAAGEQTCRSCHTDERTPDFDFDAAWAKIKH